MAASSRVIRLDLSPALYAPLEHHALEQDVGVADFLRYLVVQWASEHPLPGDSSDT